MTEKQTDFVRIIICFVGPLSILFLFMLLLHF